MIDALPSLNRTDATFKTDVDTFFGTELPAFSVQAEAARVQINSNTTTAQQQADLAQAQTLIATQQAQAAASSALSAGAIVWVTGTTYAIGNLRYSPLNSQVYRRLTAGAGTTDPSLDATNWIIVNGITSENINIPANNLPILRSTLNLDFANNQAVDPRITFTRASIATRINAKGLIEVVASGVPRIDYDAITGACKGLLIEEQRSNLLTYSEQFDNAAWTKTRATVTANATTAPDGTLTADKLAEDTTASSSHLAIGPAATVAGTAYCISTCIKSAERSWVYITGSSASFGSGVFAFFNATTGAIGFTAGCTALCTPLGNGWFRASITATATVTGTQAAYQINLSTGDATYTHTGDGTSGLFIWGAQLEAGAFPTSYIPTVASQVTRAADVATMTGANFSSWYRQDEGSFVVGFDAPNIPTDTATYNRVYSVNSGTNANAIELYVNGGWTPDRVGVAVTSSSVSVFDTTGTANGYIASPIAYAVNAVAYKADSFAASWNGVAAVTDSSGAVPTVNQINIGGFSTINQLNGHIRSLSYYPKRLTNAELVALSTQ